MRKILKKTELHPTIRDQVMTYHSDVVDEVADAVGNNRVVVVGMKWNDAVFKARRNLQKAGLEFTYLEYGSYTSFWRKRLALKMWTGFPTFPMIFIDQQLIGGNSDLEIYLKENGLS